MPSGVGVVIHGAISDSPYDVPMRANPSTHALNVMLYEHHEIHQGSHYFVEDVADIAINNVLAVLASRTSSTICLILLTKPLIFS